MSDATGSHKLLEVNGGKFYSTTAGGGNFIASQPYLTSAGTIFETDTNNSDSFTNTKILHIFDGYNGATPAGGLIKIKNSLYGTTCQNAINNNGTVAVKQNGIIYRYDLKASGNKYVVLHRFNGSNGACPQGELLKAKNGKLYGTTSAGGKVGEGVIFELDINRPKPIYRVVHNFDGIQGGHPRQTLVQSSKGGSIYGVTFDGGNPDKGVVFKFDVTRLMTKYSVIHEFDDWASGKNPGNILYGKDCNLYGVANGGPYKGGLVYRIKLNAGNNRCR